jgi:hypothetical protein
MNQNTEIAKYLIGSGTKQIIGVLGSGDSFELVESFISNGGEFLETPTEFSAPIIASAINKLDNNQNHAASISIRGPGLVSSLPGLYHNFIEDLNSVSISEDLGYEDSIYNYHKTFDAENALNSVGFCRKNLDNKLQLSDLISNSKINHENRMVHFTTRSNHFYSYSRMINEMCSDQSEGIESKNRKRLFVFGKRGMEYLAEKNLIMPNIPYFLTPAGLPYADLNSSNFLGVWTGREQFKSYFLESKDLSESIIVRVGVMKRELLTLKSNLNYFDIPLSAEDTNIELLEYLDKFGSTNVSKEKNYLVTFRKKIAKSADIWSVYSVIAMINELQIEFNYSFDVGSYATIIENYIRPIKKRRLHSAFVGKFMGTAVPIAIGISLAEPSIPVLCMLGEGSLASSFNEIISIANLQLPVCIIVFSDGRMHSVVNSKLIEEQIKSKFLPANFKTLEKIKIPNLPTASVNSLRQFNSAFSKWDMRSPLMLFLKFDPSTYAKGVELIR